MKLRLADLAGPAGMALFILAVQILSLLLVAPLTSYDLKAFENPQSVWNPVFYIVLIIVFSAVLLVIIKFNLRWIIQLFMIFAVFSTLIYVLFGVATLLLPGLTWEVVLAASVLISILLTALMVVYPEWYIVDSVGILVAAGASALFGISLSVIPTIILLVLLAVYDFIAVYKTKHMIKLAEGVMDLKLPILFVLPRKLDYSYVRSKTQKLEPGKEREAYFMGLGDAVMPTVLAVSASAFLTAPKILGFTNVPAIGVIIGTLLSYAVLMYFVMKGKPQAGLPFLCTGAIVGFLAGCAAIGFNPFF
ncbi:presenilin family intramembrane aspartyl protease PSH [Methanocella sp. MCL-LM]|uniref:presenilin family intramembrane aspartyl protease PSH n=1 Tax=Methanocella sp. MCL-LM TaxID=3412035 RepID=UPI003C795221